MNTNLVAVLTKVLADLGGDWSYEQVLATLGTIVFIAKLLYKYLPDSVQSGKFGTILEHLGIEGSTTSEIEKVISKPEPPTVNPPSPPIPRL